MSERYCDWEGNVWEPVADGGWTRLGSTDWVPTLGTLDRVYGPLEELNDE